MKRVFYRKSPHYLPLAVLALLPMACGGEATPAGPDTELRQPSAFQEGAVAAAYVAPSEGGWPERYLSHLLVGSKESHRFALERLIEIGPAAGPAIEAEIREHLATRSSMGYLVNLCSALSGCEAVEQAEVLFDLLEQDHTPVVRTAAMEGIAALTPAGQEERLLALVSKEFESAPRIAGLSALAAYGTGPCLDYLLAGAHSWLDAEGANIAGQDAFSALLLVEKPAAALALMDLEPKLPPFPALKAYGIRIALGERDLAEKIRPYLQAEVYPSSSTRELALQLLGELGDWESVLGARLDGSPGIQLAIVALLRRPDAAEAGIGLALLEEYAETADDPDLRFNALMGLLERGFDNRIDPYLRAAREFPTGVGSVEAVIVLGKDGVANERSAGVLIDRWPYAQGSHRGDLLRAMTRSKSMDAAAFLLEVALDEEETESMRATAATLLANFGVEAVPLLVRLWRAHATPGIAQIVVPGLGRFPDNPEARALIIELASSEAVHDVIRRETMKNLPRIFKQEAFDILMDLREQTDRQEVRRYLDGILTEFF
ncbi:MAG: hypothetical protein ACPG31_07050 [Planctomycetota bacterium]